MEIIRPRLNQQFIMNDWQREYLLNNAAKSTMKQMKEDLEVSPHVISRWIKELGIKRDNRVFGGDRIF